MESRAPYQRIWQTLAAEKALVLLAGPRQVGKTTLARLIAGTFANSAYANWDLPADRARIVSDPAFFTKAPRRDASRPLVILDEIHKQPRWKAWLKGLYDGWAADYRFLVTGSGRLDLHQRGGDSLAGRHLLFHLWPFTLGELHGGARTMAEFRRTPLAVSLDRRLELAGTWTRLEELSGFPEPFLGGRVASYRRWSAAYGSQLVRQDIRDLAGLRSVTQAETLYQLLPSRVGSPLSVPSLARDLGVAYNTVQGWLALFERFFLVFGLPTWTSRIARAIRKERKYYLLDVARIEDPAARFENQVALELLRATSCWNALGEGEFTLHFVRDKQRREADFLLVDRRKPLLLVEAKLGDERPGPGLQALQRALRVPAVQLVREATAFRALRNDDLDLLVAPACCWLGGLP
ncbi:MAG: ATP-binding protein [Deltaproteobacteria bacterium]|nr:ATP-binding protein [Deltaproteobacteria bacterium]